MIDQLTGGCQCRRIRYAIDHASDYSAEPEGFAGVHICHCRMCQKAVGNIHAVWLPVPADRIRITGEPKAYASSPFLERLFCAHCGTPIGSRYRRHVEDWPFTHLMGILAGTLDDPELVRPEFHFGIESRISWDDIAPDLPQKRTDELPGFAALWEQLPP